MHICKLLDYHGQVQVQYKLHFFIAKH